MEQTNKYQQGKIYKIISPHTDKIYIGSTCKKYLSQRLTAHTSSYKEKLKNNTRDKIMSYELLALGDVEIILLETYPCNSKDELVARERHWMDQNRDIIINKVIPFRTRIEHYRETDTVQKWREENKEKVLEANRKSQLKYRAERYASYNKKFNCVCGGNYTHGAITKHNKTDKHETYELIQTL
jgi:hypothetical protein